MEVFFYGLFMERSLLIEKGLSPGKQSVAFVDGFRLRIGERATLAPMVGARAYGVVMTLSTDEVNSLYADSSVADYLPESLTVSLDDGSQVTAISYLLPADKTSGGNIAYAKALYHVANALGFPEDYLNEINQIVISDLRSQ